MRQAITVLAFLVCGCQTFPNETLPLFDLAQVKAEPDRFLSEQTGKRVKISGYFFDPLFLPGCYAPSSHQSGDDIRDTYVDLPYSNEATFQATVHQKIVVEATVRKPKRFRFGGGDLYFQVEKSEQDFYLDDAKLISIDTSVPRCDR